MEEPHGVGVGYMEHVAVVGDSGRRMQRYAVNAAADAFQGPAPCRPGKARDEAVAAQDLRGPVDVGDQVQVGDRIVHCRAQRRGREA
jgi:hypothetical protein